MKNKPRWLMNLSKHWFDSLYVIEEAERVNNRRRWKCLCECGNTVIVAMDMLRTGKTTSCTDCAKKAAKERLAFNGSETPEYIAWGSMKTRCYNPNSVKYPDYGGRGIKVCERWVNSFSNFLADMGKRPSSKHSLGRIDNNGSYEPSNCHWETGKEQGTNKRNNIILTHEGKSMPLSNWADYLNVPYSKIYARYKSGKTSGQILA